MLSQPSPLTSSQHTSLTAKEQMHVARSTGTPLISYTTKTDQKQQEQHQPGLFGALAAREREREESSKSHNRYSMNNQMVQQAIAARHQQQMEAEDRARVEYQIKMQQEAAKQAQAAQQLMLQQQAAQQAAQALQMQQQMQYQNAMMGQQSQSPTVYSPHSRAPSMLGMQSHAPSVLRMQSQAPSVYGMQRRNSVLTQGSWQPQQQQQPTQQNFGIASPGAQSPAHGFSSPFAQQLWERQQAVLQGQSSMSPGGQQWQPQQR